MGDDADEADAGGGQGFGGFGAAAGGAPLGRITPNKNRLLQAADPEGARKLFDEGRRRVFLEWFGATSNLSWSARKAGVHYRTVLRHRLEDPVFQEAYDLAEAQSGPRLRAWLAEVGEEAKRVVAEAVLGSEDGDALDEIAAMRPGRRG